VKLHVEQRKAPFLASREGKLELPVDEVEREAVKQLTSEYHFDERRGRLVPTKGKKEVEETRRVFNRHIAAVSTKKIEGAIELDPDQAEAFLDGFNKQDLMENLGPPAGGSGAPRGAGGPRGPDAAGGWRTMEKPESGAPSVAGESARPTAASEGPLAPEGRQSLDTMRPGKAARAERPTAAARDPGLGELGAKYNDTELRGNLPAIKRENKRMEALDKETAAPSVIGKATSPRTGLVNVPELVKGGGGVDKAEMHKRLLKADRDGIIELRQEAGLGRMSKEELDLAIPMSGGNGHLGSFRIAEPEKFSALLEEWGIAGAGAAAATALSDDKESAAAGAGAVGLARVIPKRP